jgi:hypothetical protein
MESTLKKYVNKALSNRLEDCNFTNSEQLLGDCYYNTKELAKILENNNILYSIYCGALMGDYKPEQKPESFEDAKEIGLVHYWIESNGYICEIASESERYFGESVVLNSRPNNYIIFEDSIKSSI